jgi:hypothetical protein
LIYKLYFGLTIYAAAQQFDLTRPPSSPTIRLCAAQTKKQRDAVQSPLS